MIDLKRPLEGIPGLLLLAALVLFGATIGVVAGLVASWIDLKDSIANFLGGVVGAGLGPCPLTARRRHPFGPGPRGR